MMVDWRKIVRSTEATSGGVLATLVGVRGSSYRKVGARLLLTDDGAIVGSVSGGCLEAELLQRAKWLIRNGPIVQHYSTGFEDTEEIPYGLGCGGELDLLLEAVNSREVQSLLSEVKAVFSGEARRVVSWMPTKSRTLRRAIFRLVDGLPGDLLFSSDGVDEDEVHWARTAGAERVVDGDETTTVFVEDMVPPQRLVVAGAGEDARPMVALGAMLGWNVVVMDGRRQLAQAERFPEASSVVFLGPETPVTLRPDDAIVLMTHSYEQDRMLLAAAIPVAPRYLGLLGARHRSSLLVGEVAMQLGMPITTCCERLHAPMGLDLGGDGAEVIALAVIAEIQACVQGKVSTSRWLRPEEIVEQMQVGGAAQYLQAQCALGQA